jgi:hypothetical protein
MSFTATTYRVLIASPSNLTEEREAATMAINDWNAQHAAAEGIVLLPVKWETHARPESGVRPQGAINTQIVQTCDVLIGMFWTKLGTDTGVAESGTVEEINQFVEQKKPALLYFSDRLTAPSAINLEQLRKLKDFKDTTYSQALVGSFCSVDELRTKLLRDLTRQIRTLPPALNVKVVDIHIPPQDDNRTFPLKCYVTLQNNSTTCADVRLSEYRAHKVTLKQFTFDALQVRLRDWEPEIAVSRVAVFPEQLIRAWVGLDEKKFSADQVNELRGQIGTLILLVDGKPMPIDL